MLSQIESMTKSKIFLFLLLAFIGGVGAGSFFDISQRVVLVVAIAAASLVAVFYRRGSRILSFPVALAAFLVLAFSAGVLRFDASESLTKALTNFNDINENVQLLGYISDEPERLIGKQRLTLLVKEIRVPGYSVSADEKVLITENLYPEFEYGDLVLAEGKLQSPKNFDDFDYTAYLAKDAIFSLSYYPKIEKVSLSEFFRKTPVSKFESIKISLFRKIFKVKKVFEESVERVIAEPNASFVNGILLGSRENIPQDLKEAFNETGTTHILAISGYNITIVAFYISSFFLFFMRRQAAFWMTVLAIILFTILTGASASVIRAAIMGILVLVAYREGRFYNMTNSIVFAGAAMIAFNPKILRFDAGFQLSFLAAVGLVFLSPIIKEKLKAAPEFWSFKENFIATVSAQVMVLPLILHHFKNLSFVSVPANFLILPVVPLTMLFGFVAGIAGLIWLRLGEFFGLAAWLFSGYEISIVRFLASFPLASKPVFLDWPWMLAFYSLAFFLIYKSSKTANEVK